jgi:hypothetical protein
MVLHDLTTAIGDRPSSMFFAKYYLAPLWPLEIDCPAIDRST